MVILDFAKREGRSGWSRTIIAVKTNSQVKKPYDFETYQAGPWQLIYLPVHFFREKKLMQLDHLEIILKGVAQS